MKNCWHKWDIYKEKKLICGGNNSHIRKTKICRKCGEKRIKEKIGM